LTLGLDRSVLFCNRNCWRLALRLWCAHAGLLVRQFAVNQISDSDISEAVLLNGIQVPGGPPLRHVHPMPTFLTAAKGSAKSVKSHAFLETPVSPDLHRILHVDCVVPTRVHDTGRTNGVNPRTLADERDVKFKRVVADQYICRVDRAPKFGQDMRFILTGDSQLGEMRAIVDKHPDAYDSASEGVQGAPFARLGSSDTVSISSPTVRRYCVGVRFVSFISLSKTKGAPELRGWD